MFHAMFGLTELGPAELQILLDTLTMLNIAWIRRNPDCPALYESGVIYETDGAQIDGWEQWDTIPLAIARGSADCKVLAAWRAAELCATGRPTSCCMTTRELDNGVSLTHVRVKNDKTGAVEDPSALLGMPQ